RGTSHRRRSRRRRCRASARACRRLQAPPRSRRCQGARPAARALHATGCRTALAVPSNPVELALADLWSRSTREMSTACARSSRSTSSSSPTAGCGSWAARRCTRVPEVLDYVAMRRKTGRPRVAVDLMQQALNVELAPQTLSAQSHAPLLEAFADATQLSYDIVSY